MGEGWGQGLAEAITHCRMVVLVMSRGPFSCKHGRDCQYNCQENIARLAAKPELCDNVLLEVQKLSELRRGTKLSELSRGKQTGSVPDFTRLLPTTLHQSVCTCTLRRYTICTRKSNRRANELSSTTWPLSSSKSGVSRRSCRYWSAITSKMTTSAMSTEIFSTNSSPASTGIVCPISAYMEFKRGRFTCSLRSPSSRCQSNRAR